MKILLFGEYRGFHKYLKESLKAIGEDVTLVASDDGWKKFTGYDLLLFEPRKIKGKEQLLKNIIFSFEYSKEL